MHDALGDWLLAAPRQTGFSGGPSTTSQRIPLRSYDVRALCIAQLRSVCERAIM